MKAGKGKEKARLLEEIPDTTGAGSSSAGYQLRIHIIEARDLKGRDASGQSDPICVVSALGKKGETAIHKKTTICVWDHLFIWEFPQVSEKEFFQGVVTVDVYDANTLMRNEMIGSFELNLKFVYQGEGHEIYRRWVALADPTDKFEGVQGYLKLSVTALAAGDTPVVHSEEDAEDEGSGDSSSLQSLVLLPPSIHVEERLLNVRVYNAEGLPKLDTFGTCDPFVQVKFAGLIIKTETKEKTQAPSFNETLQIPVSLPVMAEEIQVSVWDFDAVGKNEIIATALIKFSEVQAGKYNTAQWINLYGSPYPEENRKIVAMNSGFTEASAFRGRLLISFDSQPTKDAKLGKAPVSPAAPPGTREYTALLDVFEGARLDAEDAAIDVELAVGPLSVFSKRVKTAKEGKSVWYENLAPIQIGLPHDLAQCPDIFINVFRHAPLLERKRIGLLRIKAQDAYTNSRAEPKWNLLQRDILLDSNNSFSGFLLSRLIFAPTPEANSIPRASVQPPVLKGYHLRAYIYQAKGLHAADENGLSDPYCVVHLAGKVAKTKVQKETRFPQWYETIALDVELPENLNLASSISILVYDKDQFSADDLLGLVHVPITSVTASNPVPKWYPLFTSEENFGKADRGELLAAFQLLLPEQSGTPIPNINPQYKDAAIGFGVIGLRNLIPFALQPIQNSYVEIRCGRDEPVRTKPSKTPSGSNPNFLENLEIPVKLPIDPLYSPVVEVKVFDNRVVYKPLIGTTTINIDNLLPWVNNSAEIEEIPDNAEVPHAPIVDTAPPPAQSKNGSIIDVNASDIHQDDASSSFIGKGKGKEEDFGIELKLSAPLVKTPSTESITKAPSRDEVSVLIEDGGAGPSGVDDLPLLAGTKLKDLTVNLPNMALRTLASVPDKIPLGLEVHEMESKEEASGEIPRPRVAKELEKYYKASFSSWSLYKGKQAGLGLLKKTPSYTTTGVLKGQVRVTDGTSEPAIALKELYRPLPYVLRAYVLRGIGIMPKDPNGLCDPYIVINTNGAKGKKMVEKDLENGKKETLNPNFYKCYELTVNLPGESELEIEVWDWDKASGDDLVGKTTIDLENRQFSEDWRALDVKPIEVRSLWHPQSSNSQGQLEMWLDILTPEEAARQPRVEISPPVPRNFELRMVIWNTKDVVFKDAKMSDIFVVGYPEGVEPQKTDIHWRSENGEGMFNWRMVFPVTLPCKTPRLKIQIWDKDLLNPNDVIAEASLNLQGFFKKAFKDHNKHTHSIDKQFITLTHPNFPGPQGRVEVSVELILEEEARKYPVGLGRKEPNQNPHLPPPDRPETSFNPLNPFSYFSKVFWKNNRGKVICCCIILVIVVLIPILLFIANAASNFI